MFALKILLLLGICVFLKFSMALRCRTEDGPSMEDIKKVVRTCMNKHDSSSTFSSNNRNLNKYNEFYDDSDESDNESDDDNNQSQEDAYSNHNNRNRYNNNNNNNQYPYNSDNRGNSNNNNNNNRYGNDNHGNNHRQYLVASYKRLRRMQQTPMEWSPNNPWTKRINYNNNNNDNNNNNQQRSYEANTNGDNNHQNSSTRLHNNDSNSCMVLCFFQEMKMTNRDGFPDKNKMLNVMTHDLRDMQLKDFYVDTIQECHHILEMEQPRDKCAFARHIVTCLSERARSNCEDFQESILF